MNKEEKRYLKKILNVETFNVTGILNGILVITHDVRIAKKIFRKKYPNQKIFHAKDEIIERLKYLNDNIDVMSQSPSSSNDLSKGQVTLYLYSYTEQEREDLFKIIDEFDHNLQVAKNNSYKQEKALLEKKLKRIL